jgi:hypothetical protein
VRLAYGLTGDRGLTGDLAQTTLAKFDAPGTPWTIHVQTGGFGVCEFATPSTEHFGGAGCARPGFQAANHPLDGLGVGGGDPAVLVVGPLEPRVTRVTRVVATLTDGETVQLPFRTIDGEGSGADVFAPSKKVDSLTAYEKIDGIREERIDARLREVALAPGGS